MIQIFQVIDPILPLHQRQTSTLLQQFVIFPLFDIDSHLSHGGERGGIILELTGGGGIGDGRGSVVVVVVGGGGGGCV